LNSTGLLVDFKALKSILNEVLEELDHRLLNDHPAFFEVNPSSENIALFIFTKVKEKLSQKFPEVRVKEVSVYESEKAWATYSE